jgi:hypothetical protein
MPCRSFSSLKSLENSYRGAPSARIPRKAGPMADLVSRKTSDDSLLVYRSTLKSLTTDGTIPLETQRKIIASHRESLKMDKEIAPEKIFDFSVLRSIK